MNLENYEARHLILGDLISSFQLSSSGLGYRLFEGQFFDYLKPHQSVDSLCGNSIGSMRQAPSQIPSLLISACQAS